MLVHISTALFSPFASSGLLISGNFKPSGDDGGGEFILLSKEDATKLKSLLTGGSTASISGFLTTTKGYKGFLSTTSNELSWTFSMYMSTSSTLIKSSSSSSMEPCVLVPDGGGANVMGSCSFGSGTSNATKFIPLRPADMAKISGPAANGGTLIPRASNTPPARVSFPPGMSSSSSWTTITMTRTITTTIITKITITTIVTKMSTGGAKVSFFSPLKPNLRVGGVFVKSAAAAAGGELGNFTASTAGELSKFRMQGSISGYLVLDGAPDVAPLSVFLTLTGSGDSAKVWSSGVENSGSSGSSAGGGGGGGAESTKKVSGPEAGKE